MKTKMVFKIFYITTFIWIFITTEIHAGKLKVIGDKIYNDSGQVVILKGVNLPGLEWDKGPANNNITRKTIIYLATEWNANVIRLPLNAQWYIDDPVYRQVVKDVQNWCAENGLWLIIDYHWVDEVQKQAKLPGTNATTFWSMVAHNFKDADNVIYDIYNEPFWVAYSDWANVANNLMNIIKNIDSNAIFLINGVSWGYDHQNNAYWTDKDNVIYGTHDYPGKDNDASAYEFLFGQHPVLVGELGYWTDDQSSPTGVKGDPAYLYDLLNKINNNGLSYTAWSFHWEAAPTLLQSDDTTYPRTEYGDIIYNDIRGTSLLKYIDRTPLYPVLVLGSSNKIYIEFNKNIDPQTAIIPENYSIQGENTSYNIVDIDTVAYGNHVTLTLDKELDYNELITITLSNIQDITLGKNIVESKPDTINFIYSQKEGEVVNVAEDDSVFVYGKSPYGYIFPPDTAIGINFGVYTSGSYLEKTGIVEVDSALGKYAWGIIGYKYMVCDTGNYRVKMYMYDYTGLASDTGRVVYSVVVEGDTIIDSLDYFLESQAYCAPKKAFAIYYDVKLSDKQLDIDFIPYSGRVFLNAIVVERNPKDFENGKLEYGPFVLGQFDTNTCEESFINRDIIVLKNEINIYPNPFNPIFNVAYKFKNKNELIISVYDITGKLIYKYTKKDVYGIGRVSINMLRYPSGVYFVNIQHGEYYINKKILFIK